MPEDAKEVIKPWDKREDTEKFAESNVDVDDQVSLETNPHFNQLPNRKVLGYNPCPFLAECALKICAIKAWYAAQYLSLFLGADLSLHR